MIDIAGERFRLAISIHDAISFAMGRCDLGYENPKTALRKIVGFLAIDALEYSEQWRAAALLSESLHDRWRDEAD